MKHIESRSKFYISNVKKTEPSKVIKVRRMSRKQLDMLTTAGYIVIFT